MSQRYPKIPQESPNLRLQDLIGVGVKTEMRLPIRPELGDFDRLRAAG